MSAIDDLLAAYPDEDERERLEAEGKVSRDLAPVRKPNTKKDFDRATRVKALRFRLSGMTYAQIGKKLNVSTAEARAVIQYALKTAESDSVEEMRDLENHRLDAMLKAIWDNVVAGDVQAVDRALKIVQTRARLNGLEAPRKLDLALSVRAEVEENLRNLENLIEAEVVPTPAIAPPAVEDAEVVPDTSNDSETS